MSNLSGPVSRTWPEWDRETVKTEMHLESDGENLTIRAVADDQDVARLKARRDGDTLVITEIHVPVEITVAKKGFFSKATTKPGRGRGYGSLLVRALLAHARQIDAAEVVGGLKASDLQENRFALEWYSRRGFITERSPDPRVPGSAATIRFVL